MMATAGCTDSLDLSGDGSLFIAEPHAPWDLLPPSPTPAPTSTPIADFGDGSDGALSIPDGDTVIVNDCVRITGVSGATVEVADDNGFASGDRVLLWQTQVPFAMQGDAAAVATSAMGMAGVWQIARVTDTDPNELVVDVTPQDYDTALGLGRSAQVCRVPEFTDVTVPAGARIEAPAWSPGNGGGIVAFFVSGRLQLDGAISGSGRGYLGAGAHVGTNAEQDMDLLETEPADGGAKGLGLDGQSSGLYGRGNWANAGGGGNAHSGGGGGGGNGGAGGLGGKQWKPDGDVPETAGMPGAPVLATYPARLVMGGGGGEGQCHHGACGDGGDGGAMILIFASELAGAGDFLSDGDGAGPSTNDAGSGGGGGGTIIVGAGSSSFTGQFRAEGGTGADAVYDDAGDGPNGDPMPDTAGPGGGGGGGRILLFGADFATLDPDQIRVTGGQNGVNPLALNDPWGAQPGQPGTADVSQ